MIVQAALNSGCSYPNLLSRKDYTFLEFNIYYVSSSSYSRNWWASSKGISRPNKYCICTAYQRVRAVLCLSHPLTNRFFPLRLAAAWPLTWSPFASSACDGHDLQPKEFPPETTGRSVSRVGWDFNSYWEFNQLIRKVSLSSSHPLEMATSFRVPSWGVYRRRR